MEVYQLRKPHVKSSQLNIVFYLPILQGMTCCVHRTEPTTIGLWFFRIGMLNRETDWYRGVKYCIQLHNDTLTPHWKEDPIYVSPEMKLSGFLPKFHIHVSVSDLYISTIGPPILLQRNRQTDCVVNIKIAHRYMILGLGTRPCSFISGEYLFRIFGTVSLQYDTSHLSQLPWGDVTCWQLS
jgi:hypothetical protein